MHDFVAYHVVCCGIGKISKLKVKFVHTFTVNKVFNQVLIALNTFRVKKAFVHGNPVKLIERAEEYICTVHTFLSPLVLNAFYSLE